MAKRSKRRAVRQHKDQAGCMWSFISIFDFRHGRFTRKLLSDSRHLTKGAAHITGKKNFLKGPDELNKTSNNVEKREKPTPDGVKTSVKELMEEEMFSEQGPKKQVKGAEGELFDSKNQNCANTTSKGSDINEISDVQFSSQRTSSYLDVEGIIEELLSIHQKVNEIDMRSNQTYSVVQEKLSAAVDVLIKENFITDEVLTKNGKILKSKDFIDALQMVSSNKELFLKLIQDPNSLLLKQIRGSEEAHSEKEQTTKSISTANILEDESNNSKAEESVPRKHRNFFRRRSKSLESNPLKENDRSQLSSTIVILKPGHCDDGINDGTNEKVDNDIQRASHFSFLEIKRRLKHAVGKDRHSVDSEKGAVEGTVGWSSPNRDHFYTERFAKVSSGLKKGERVSKLRDLERKILEEDEANGEINQRVSDIYMEAKKHLSEMLSSGNEDAELMIRSLPKTLGRILSLPEYNYSPIVSPRKEMESGFITAQTGVAPQLVKESQTCVPNEGPDEKQLSSNSDPEASCDLISDDSMRERESSLHEEISYEGVIHTINSSEIENHEEVKILDDSCERCLDANDVVNDEITVEGLDEERISLPLELDSPEESKMPCSPPVSPRSSSCTSRTEELENSVDKIGRPSPISVLDPLFSEDDISPASSSSRPVEAAIQPLHIQFEEIISPASEKEICIETCAQNEESAFEYVEAVLLASDLNWDQFLARWIFCDQILDSSLFEEVELFSNCSCHDQRLLFDCTNEILKEVCDCYFVKQTLRPVPRGMELINEVWGGIESLLLQTPVPRSLEQLVRKDLNKFGTWMDLHMDTEEIVCEMEESILEGLMDDALLILVSDCIDEEHVSDEI